MPCESAIYCGVEACARRLELDSMLKGSLGSVSLNSGRGGTTMMEVEGIMV
jgi:hypothetical protein